MISAPTQDTSSMELIINITGAVWRIGFFLIVTEKLGYLTESPHIEEFFFIGICANLVCSVFISKGAVIYFHTVAS